MNIKILSLFLLIIVFFFIVIPGAFALKQYDSGDTVEINAVLICGAAGSNHDTHTDISCDNSYFKAKFYNPNNVLKAAPTSMIGNVPWGGMDTGPKIKYTLPQTGSGTPSQYIKQFCSFSPDSHIPFPHLFTQTRPVESHP